MPPHQPALSSEAPPQQPAVVQVTRATFEATLPAVRDALNACDFYAIDCEMTGLHLDGHTDGELDGYEDRYRKLAANASQFLITQFGISAFVWNAASRSYQARTFNFWLFPAVLESNNYLSERLDQRFVCQASSLMFLASQGFDFNRMILQGIPFLSLHERNKRLRALQQRAESLTAKVKAASSASKSAASAKSTGATAATNSAGAITTTTTTSSTTTTTDDVSASSDIAAIAAGSPSPVSTGAGATINGPSANGANAAATTNGSPATSASTSAPATPSATSSSSSASAPAGPLATSSSASAPAPAAPSATSSSTSATTPTTNDLSPDSTSPAAITNDVSASGATTSATAAMSASSSSTGAITTTINGASSNGASATPANANGASAASDPTSSRSATTNGTSDSSSSSSSSSSAGVDEQPAWLNSSPSWWDSASAAAVREAAGFSTVLELMRDSKKPATGHNMMYDLGFLLNAFVEPLPRSWPAFKALVGRWFPAGVYDTKHVALQLGQRYRQTDLKSLYTAAVLEPAPGSAGGWPPVSLAPPPAGLAAAVAASSDAALSNGGSTSAVASRAHEAGFDAYMTGAILARLARAHDTGVMSHLPFANGDAPSLRPLALLRNRVHMMRTDLEYFALAGNDPIPSRPNVLHLAGFPLGLTEAELASRLLQTGYGYARVTLLLPSSSSGGGAAAAARASTKTSALVELSQPESPTAVAAKLQKLGWSGVSVQKFSAYHYQEQQQRQQQQQKGQGRAGEGFARGSGPGRGGGGGAAGASHGVTRSPPPTLPLQAERVAATPPPPPPRPLRRLKISPPPNAAGLPPAEASVAPIAADGANASSASTADAAASNTETPSTSVARSVDVATPAPHGSDSNGSTDGIDSGAGGGRDGPTPANVSSQEASVSSSSSSVVEASTISGRPSFDAVPAALTLATAYPSAAQLAARLASLKVPAADKQGGSSTAGASTLAARPQRPSRRAF